ncbi:MAG: BamA/TamA family outer membrane protein [Muribaculaceae bacterium]|nr:BamA/TamA family outer membrane protein [Muribaculaceae bacterium]
MMTKNNIYIALGICLIAILYSCSTTKKLGEGEVLYIGVEHDDIHTHDNQDIDEGVEDLLFDAINVAPNNALISPYYRSPFPLGLWVYNNWTITEKTNKFKKWLYDRLVSQPVLISTVSPKQRVEMIKDILDNNGYFGSTAYFDILYDKKNPKKAKISYDIYTTEPYTISSIELIKGNDSITMAIDSIARNFDYIKPGNRYCTDSLQMVRTEITNHLRRRGYYYFRPEFIVYSADSTIEKGKIALRMNYEENIPENSKRKYKTGKITTIIKRNLGGGYPDTINTAQGTIIQMKPSRLRSNILEPCITFKEGKLFNVRNIDRTQSFLARLGIFKNINIEIPPIDSIKNEQEAIDVIINCTLDSPLETTLQFNTSYKSNSFLGPGISAGLSHNNIFGGGEQLSVNLSASYEWQIGKNASSSGDNNYYEFGVNSTLAFPRLLAPKFISSTRRFQNWTKVSLGANLYNNPSSIKYMQISTEYTYEWHTNRISMHQLSLPKLTYSKRLRDVENIENTNEMMNKRSEFIAQISYTYTFDKTFGEHNENNIKWQSTISEAGNILSGIWSLAGAPSETGSRNLFGVPYSQYVKLHSQFVYSRSFLKSHAIVFRSMIGAGFVYGNSYYMPYGEDFYAGGPNSIRAFATRSLGPGSFKELDGVDSPYLHSGSFQFILNAEYRFPIFGIFKGALFLDAGNVWLLKDEFNLYEGGMLTGKSFLKDIALGSGIGLRVDLNMLVVRADLGVALHAPYETGKSGYFNIPSFKKSLALNIAIGYPF